MDARPVKIFCKEDVPRLRYIAGIIMGDILGLTWEIITDRRKLGKYHVINYSSDKIAGSFKISPNPLLYETGIAEKEIIVNDWNGLPAFFPTTADSDLPFDIFAASFFLVSRYEEYLDFQPDEHGRFNASSSIAFRNGFLGIPVVDLWAKEMARFLLRKFQTIVFRRNDYKALLTMDTDEPYSNHSRNLFRSIGEIFRIRKSNSGNAGEGNRIVSKGEKDPFDVFDYITDTIEKSNTDARFFFPVGDHSKHDKNPSWKNEEYRNLIHRISEKFKIGLHPSFYASGDPSMINTEVSRLKTILKEGVFLSRFHYIRLFFPRSYHAIHEAGITEDYSMGYPDEPGFRAGIARPFYFYDVSENKQTTLKIIPFQIMDETLYDYKKLDPVASKEIILKLINETKKAGGLFVSIWHNTSLLEDPGWQSGREVFEFMLKNQKL